MLNGRKTKPNTGFTYLAPKLCVFLCCGWNIDPPGVCNVFPLVGRISRLPAEPAGPDWTSSLDLDNEDEVDPEVLGGASNFSDNLLENSESIWVGITVAFTMLWRE